MRGETWETPTALNAAQLEYCRSALVGYEAYLTPAPRTRLLARIATLLAHFYAPDIPDTLRRGIAQDWAETLEDLPWHGIVWACSQWLKIEKRRPTPAEIRRLTLEECEPDMRIRNRLQRIVAGGVKEPKPREKYISEYTPVELREWEARMAELKRTLGTATKPMPGVRRRGPPPLTAEERTRLKEDFELQREAREAVG